MKPARQARRRDTGPRAGKTRAPSLHERAAGVLLHPTSLPGPHGSGDLGAEARRFIDFLSAAGQRWWQMLPVGPAGFGNSPYSALSAFAGNPLLLDLDALAEDGLLDAAELSRARLPAKRVDYGRASRFREQHLRRAFARFESRKNVRLRRELDAFREANAAWLPDFALFSAIKQSQGLVQWTLWPDELRSRDRAALERARRDLDADVRFHEFEQWQFARQWRALKAYADGKRVALIGDLPIFVAHDSADVWANPELFQLDARGMPTVIAGVPPDYFSKTGQRWGNPLYRWDRLKSQGFGWWIERFRKTLERFDAVRLDHFIGFQRYWEIPADKPTAVEGRWVPGPGADLFEAVRAALGTLPLIAEDLGAVTPEVKALRDRFELPGIRILQFAFGTDPSAPDFKPHNYPRRCVVYTGTHDNDTTVGWFYEGGGGESTRSRAQTEKERRFALEYLGSPGKEIHWEMLRATHASVADLVIAPMQDLLGLGSDARMNRPGQPSGNWEWRMAAGAASPALAKRLARMTSIYDRLPAE